jgi:hypothetical protein
MWGAGGGTECITVANSDSRSRKKSTKEAKGLDLSRCFLHVSIGNVEIYLKYLDQVVNRSLLTTHPLLLQQRNLHCHSIGISSKCHWLSLNSSFHFSSPYTLVQPITGVAKYL